MGTRIQTMGTRMQAMGTRIQNVGTRIYIKGTRKQNVVTIIQNVIFWGETYFNIVHRQHSLNASFVFSISQRKETFCFI